jgi:DNA (cytosine-5)-methyltransferase 1
MSNLRNSQLLQQMESNPLRSSLAKALDIAEEFQGAIEFVSGNRDLSPEGRQKATQAHLRKAIRDQPSPMRNWPGFDDLIATLKKTYKLRIGPIDASDFGTPQSRRRLFIVGDRVVMPTLALPGLKPTRDASCILERKGSYAAEPVYNGKRAASTIARVERGIAELGRGKDFLIVYYGSDRAGGWQRLDRPLRTLTTLDRFGLVQWVEGEPTLRMLQVPELKRAMGLTHLKDEHGNGVKFTLDRGTRRDKIKVLGNGVCAPVMRAVVGSLLGASSRDVLGDELIPARLRSPLLSERRAARQRGATRSPSY